MSVALDYVNLPVIGGPLPPLPTPPIPPGALLVPPSLLSTYSPTLPALNCQPTLLSPLQFTLFGGGAFNLPMPMAAGDPLKQMSRGLDALGLQLAPLGPVITQLKFANAVANLVTNLPSDMAQLIAFNPSPLATDVAAVVGASSDLVALAVLPLQLISMTRGAVQLLVSYFTALKNRITTIVARYTNVNAIIAAATAAGRTALLANMTCKRERLDTAVTAMNNSIVAAGLVLAMIQVIICLVAGHATVLPGVPTLSPAGLVATVFDAVIAALNAILTILPNLSGVNGLRC